MYSRKSFVTVHFFLLIFLTAVCPHEGQSEITGKHDGDTSTVKKYAALSFESASSDPGKGLDYARQALKLSGEIGFTEGMALSYSRMGLCFKYLAKYDSAMYYFFAGLEYYRASGLKPGEANALNSIGTLHQKIGTYDSAAFYLFKSLHMAELIKDTGLLASIFNNLGIVMRKEGKFNDAIKYYNQALLFSDFLNNKKSIANAHQNLGICYYFINKFDTAENHYDAALKIFELLDDKRGLGQININIASMRQKQGRHKEALSLALKSVDYYIDLNNPNGVSEAYLTLAEISRGMKNHGAAIAYASKSLTLADEVGNKETALELCQLLNAIYMEDGDYKNAYKYLSKTSALGNSIFNEKKESIINGLQAKYETEKKDKEIKLLNKSNEIKSLAIKKQAIIRNSLISGTVLLVIIGMLLFNHYRISQKQQQQAERMRISSDLHDEVGSTLSSIGLYSSYAGQLLAENKKGEAGNILEEIHSSSLEMIDDMNDIIWAINPRNDSYEHMVDRLRNYASRVAHYKNIKLNFEADEMLNSIVLNMGDRKNLYLICKESINNAVKYSNCQNLFVLLQKIKNRLFIEVRDDGNGFNVNSSYEGNGLKNMKQRAGGLKATLNISSESNKGTTISIFIHLA